MRWMVEDCSFHFIHGFIASLSSTPSSLVEVVNNALLALCLFFATVLRE